MFDEVISDFLIVQKVKKLGSQGLGSNDYVRIGVDSSNTSVLDDRMRITQKKKFAISGDDRSIIALMGGTSLAQILNLLFTPIITRLFSPGVFGSVSTYTALISISSVIVCLRYELSIVIPLKDTEAAALYRLSLNFATLFSFLVFLYLFFFNEWFFRGINAKELSLYWYYLPITLFLSGIFQASSVWLTRKKKYTVLSLSAIASAFAVNLVSVGLGFLGYNGISTRLFATALSLIIGFLVILGPIMLTSRGLANQFDDTWIALVKKYKNFLLFDLWAALINNLSWAMMPLLINGYFSSYEAGQYSVCLRVMQIPMSIIGSSISRVFLQTGSKKRENGELFSYSIACLKKMLLLTILPLFVIFLFGVPVFKVVFGSEWSVAGRYSQILVPWALIWFCASPLHGVFTVTQRQNMYLLFAVLNLSTRILSLVLGYIYRDLIIALIAFSASGVVIYALSLFFVLDEAKKSDLLIHDKTEIA